jgi:acyl-CoA thioesterase FadM
MRWEGQELGFPRVSAACDFLRPARFEDELTISVAVERLGRSSVTYAIGFSRGGEELARGRVTAVCCTPARGAGLEAREIPAFIRAKLEPWQQPSLEGRP